jgi:hypothetical protein
LIEQNKYVNIPTGNNAGNNASIVDNNQNKQSKPGIKHGTAFFRPSKTEAQIRFQKELNLRTVYVAGETDELIKFYKHKPHQLSKEIINIAGGQIDKVHLTKKGALRIVALNNTQRNKLLKITNLNNRPVQTSLPFAPQESYVREKARKTPQQYFVKAVVYGLHEDQITLDGIAKKVGACQMQQLGKTEHSKTALIKFDKNTAIPSEIEINNLKYKVNKYIPRPKRCDNCQRFCHLRFTCKRDVVCSRCSGNHEYSACTNINIYKCANCGLPHSSAYQGCPHYIEIQAALQIRAEENLPFAQALRKVQDTKNNKNLDSTVTWRQAPSYASKVKDGLIKKSPWPTIPHSVSNNLPQDVDYRLSPTESSNVPLAAAVSTMGEIDTQQMLKSFFSYNKNNYQAIKKINNGSISDDGEGILATEDRARFVLGVLALIDNSETKYHAKYILCQVASAFMYKQEVVFKCPGI